MPSRLALVFAFALTGGCTFAPVIHVDDGGAPQADNALVDHLISESRKPAPAPVVAAPVTAAPAPAAPAPTTPSWSTRRATHSDTLVRPDTSTGKRPRTGTRTSSELTRPTADDPRAGLTTSTTDDEVLEWLLEVAERLDDARIGDLPPTTPTTTLASTRPSMESSASTLTRETSSVREARSAPHEKAPAADPVVDVPAPLLTEATQAADEPEPPAADAPPAKEAPAFGSHRVVAWEGRLR